MFGASKGTIASRGPALSKTLRRRRSSIESGQPLSPPKEGEDKVRSSERITNERPTELSGDQDRETRDSGQELSKGEIAIQESNTSDELSEKAQNLDQTKEPRTYSTKSSMRRPATTTHQLRRPISLSASGQSAAPAKPLSAAPRTTTTSKSGSSHSTASRATTTAKSVSSQSATPSKSRTTALKPASQPEPSHLKTKSIHRPRSASTTSGKNGDAGHDRSGERPQSTRRSIHSKKDSRQMTDPIEHARELATTQESGREGSVNSHTRKVSVKRADPGQRTSKPTEFTTLQQHFTPRKGPKALTSSFLVPSPSKLPRPDAISAEVARNQAELLQLLVLHSSSFKIQAQWKQSAYVKMEEIFTETSNQQTQLLDHERQMQQRLNYLALQEWADGSKFGHGLEERMQILGPLLQEVLSVTDIRGRYTKVIDEFEDWSVRTQSVTKTRDAAGSISDGNTILEFVEELSPHWKSETNSLSRKLSLQSQQLEDIGHAIKGSSLATILDNLQKYVRSMLEELALIQTFEHDTLVAERHHIEAMMSSLNLENEDHNIPKSRRGIWDVSEQSR